MLFEFDQRLEIGLLIKQEKLTRAISIWLSLISQQVGFLEKFHSKLEKFHSKLETFHGKLAKFHGTYRGVKH